MSPRSWPQRRSPPGVAAWGVPWWGVVSSAAAPVLLVAGWTVAAGLQPGSFDAVGGTVSGLAGSVSAIAILLGLLAWFGAELITGAGQVGLAERVLGAAQASWPLTVVLSCCLSRTSCLTSPAGPAGTGLPR